MRQCCHEPIDRLAGMIATGDPTGHEPLAPILPSNLAGDIR